LLIALNKVIISPWQRNCPFINKLKRRISKMNYKNSYLENTQNRAFNKKLNHLQSFIGMPMWDGRKPTISEIREYDRRLLEKQALSFEKQKDGFLIRASEKLRFQLSRPVKAFLQAKQKTKNTKAEITLPTITDAKCCS